MNTGRSVMTYFHDNSAFREKRTLEREGKVVEAIGAEVMEIRDGKIKEIRNYHRYFPAKAA